MSDPVVTTPILLFGRLGEVLGREVMIAIPPGGCSVAELRRVIAREHDAGAALLDETSRAVVDQAIVGEDTPVRPGQEIAFIPPVSGG